MVAETLVKSKAVAFGRLAFCNNCHRMITFFKRVEIGEDFCYPVAVKLYRAGTPLCPQAPCGQYPFEREDDHHETTPVFPPVVPLYGADPALGKALSGQDKDQLTTTQAGDYLCRVTWPDSTALNSDTVADTPAVPACH
jgi:hypothetical protein